MATGQDLRRIALSLEGTIEYPHFDRTAYKVVRTYVTLAADEKSANVKLTPDAQAFKCMMAPEAFAPISNAFGRQGWTIVQLAELSLEELTAVIDMAWRAGAAKTPRKSRKRPSS